MNDKKVPVLGNMGGGRLQGPRPGGSNERGVSEPMSPAWGRSMGEGTASRTYPRRSDH